MKIKKKGGRQQQTQALASAPQNTSISVGRVWKAGRMDGANSWSQCRQEAGLRHSQQSCNWDSLSRWPQEAPVTARAVKSLAPSPGGCRRRCGGGSGSGGRVPFPGPTQPEQDAQPLSSAAPWPLVGGRPQECQLVLIVRGLVCHVATCPPGAGLRPPADPNEQLSAPSHAHALCPGLRLSMPQGEA